MHSDALASVAGMNYNEKTRTGVTMWVCDGCKMLVTLQVA